MNPILISAIAAMIVAVSALAGNLYTILNGRKTFLNKKNTSMFGEAKQIIESYRAQVEELTRQADEMRDEIEKLKRNNWQLMRLLSRAWNVPLDFVELQLEQENAEPFKLPPQKRGSSTRPRKPDQP